MEMGEVTDLSPSPIVVTASGVTSHPVTEWTSILVCRGGSTVVCHNGLLCRGRPKNLFPFRVTPPITIYCSTKGKE